VTAALDGGDLDLRAASAAFSRRLRDLRVKHGVSQDALARRMGVHPTAVGRFERGARKPQPGTIPRLAKGLGVKSGEPADGLTGEEAR
jgi:transcriptional regulator with XRE-family HTH domain